MRPINLAIHQAAVPPHQHVLIWDGAGVAMTGSDAASSSRQVPAGSGLKSKN